MKTVSLTRVVMFGTPPQRFAVSFAVGTRFIKIVGPGHSGPKTEHVMEWKGKAFRPGCVAATEQAVAYFLQIEASSLPDDRVEQGNDELIIAGRLPAQRQPRQKTDYHERQLPAGDRAGVG